MFFKAASWAVAFVFLAKGASKLFFLNEFITNIYLLGLNLLGYYYFGLTGLGLSFLVAYFLYLIQVYLVAKIKFGFAYYRGFIKIFCLQFTLAVGSFLIMKFINQPYQYIIGVALIIVSSWFSYKELNKRIGIKAILCSIGNKIKRH
jgi:O-antigen/teichoic acid export membrane protein